MEAKPNIERVMDWRKWCRLCGNRETEQQNSIEFDSSINFAFITQKYFAVILSELSGDENSICSECKQLLITLEQFSERCTKVHAMFSTILSTDDSLQCDTNYLQSLRDEAELDIETKQPKIERETLDKCTDTDGLDASFVEVKPQISSTEKKAGRAKKKTKARKRAEKVKTDVELKDEEMEIDALDYDNDDFENDPTFLMTSDNDETDLFAETDELQLNSDAEEKRPTRKKRQKQQMIDNKTYNCSLCELDFDGKRSFDIHNRETHPKDDNPYSCPKCPKQFTSLTKLKRHESVHLPDHLKLVHPCEFCDKRFSKLVNVQAHIRVIHTGERSFICEECGKSFVAKGALKEHQITHSNDYPFQCQFCPKKFKNTARLRTHEDIHDTTAYICPHCGLQLNTKRTLKMHMVVHSDQKKYKCQYCGNEYKRSKALKNHLILHTGLRPYVCPFCEKTFANGSNCRSHKKKAHPVELAALEASGEVLPAANIPKLEHLQPKKQEITENSIVIITTQQTDGNIVYT